MDVTIILPAYNAEATLAEALESLQAQTHADWEAIVGYRRRPGSAETDADAR